MNDPLQGHGVVALDTCVWIYHFQKHADFGRHASSILGAVAGGRARAVVSEITLLELIVRPLKLDRPDVADEYEILLENYPNLSLLPADREIVLEAARVRARHGLRAPDAIIAATGIVGGASLIITNDAKWKRLEDIEVLCLADLSG